MIFFDIDDTLMTHSVSQKKAALLFWETFAARLPYSRQEFPAVWDSVMQKHFATFMAGQISFQEHRLRRMQEIFSTDNQPLLDGEANSLFQVYLRHYEANWALFEDVLPCLDNLARYTLGIISNGNGAQQRRKLKRLGIEDRFSVVVISEEVGCWKPNPAIFQEACRQASQPAHQCFYVGDNLITDARGSQAAGMQGVWLARQDLYSSEAKVSFINSLNKLASLIPM